MESLLSKINLYSSKYYIKIINVSICRYMNKKYIIDKEYQQYVDKFK